jgi:hypothetical protein
VLPNPFTVVAALWKTLADARPWIDLNASKSGLFDGSAMGGRQWLQLASGVAIWVLLQFVLGFWRVLRAEVKLRRPAPPGETSGGQSEGS